MFDVLRRLLGLFRRESSEGLGMSAGPALVVPPMLRPLPPVAQVDIIPAAATLLEAPCTQEASPPARPNLMAARLRSVARLNPPVALARKKVLHAPVHKPRPVKAAAELKRRSDAKSGVVLGKIERLAPRPSAEIIDIERFLRARRIEAVQAELAAIFQ